MTFKIPEEGFEESSPTGNNIKGFSLFGVGGLVGWRWLVGWFGGMDTTLLFTAALRLPDPWRVSGVELRDGEGGGRESHITIGF
ncbi:transposase ISDvu5, partial [Bifidobacterium mongoliense]